MSDDMDFEGSYRVTFHDGHRETLVFEGVARRGDGDWLIQPDGSTVAVGALKSLSGENGDVLVAKGMRVSDVRPATAEELEDMVLQHIEGGPLHDAVIQIALTVETDEFEDDEDMEVSDPSSGSETQTTAQTNDLASTPKVSDSPIPWGDTTAQQPDPAAADPTPVSTDAPTADAPAATDVAPVANDKPKASSKKAADAE